MGLFHIHKWDSNCKCLKCGKTMHNWTPWQSFDEEYHVRTCRRCHKSQKEAHIFESRMIRSSESEIECSDKICDRCGFVKACEAE